VLDGYVTVEGARRDYGVVLDERGTVDEAATASLRAELHRQHAGGDRLVDPGTWEYGDVRQPRG
jgi:hypothetical protein